MFLSVCAESAAPIAPPGGKQAEQVTAWALFKQREV